MSEGFCSYAAPLGGYYYKMKNNDAGNGKETTSGRGVIRNFGDVFKAVQLILSRLDVLVLMLEELLRYKETEKK